MRLEQKEYVARDAAIAQMRAASCALSNASVHLAAMSLAGTPEAFLVSTPAAELVGGCQQIVDSMVMLLEERLEE